MPVEIGNIDKEQWSDSAAEELAEEIQHLKNLASCIDDDDDGDGFFEIELQFGNILSFIEDLANDEYDFIDGLLDELLKRNIISESVKMITEALSGALSNISYDDISSDCIEDDVKEFADGWLEFLAAIRSSFASTGAKLFGPGEDG